MLTPDIISVASCESIKCSVTTELRTSLVILPLVDDFCFQKIRFGSSYSIGNIKFHRKNIQWGLFHYKQILVSAVVG